MQIFRYPYYCTYMFLYNISSDYGNPKIEAKLHSAVVGISLVIFFMIYGSFEFLRVYARTQTDISKFPVISFAVALMIFNGFHANSRSEKFVKRFKKEENKQFTVMCLGGIFSIGSFLFMLAAALAVRKMRHFT